MTIKDLQLEEYEIDNSKENKHVNIWKIASGVEEDNISVKSWQQFVEYNYIGFGWFDLNPNINMDYRDFNNTDEIKNKLLEENKIHKKIKILLQ